MNNKRKPVQLQLPFDDSIAEVNNDLCKYYEKCTLEELDCSIKELEQSVKYWQYGYDD